jgi:hypothetical protein
MSYQIPLDDVSTMIAMLSSHLLQVAIKNDL